MLKLKVDKNFIICMDILNLKKIKLHNSLSETWKSEYGENHVQWRRLISSDQTSTPDKPL